MYRLVFLFSFFFMSLAFAQKRVEEIRILNLLPYFVQPPMVEPCLPDDFLLGKQADDPYFSRGYHWGSQRTLDDYFEDGGNLKGCLIRAQVSSTVKQIGHDRFSNDGNTQALTAAGFTEIKVNKGRWGIFPYRELLAKGPKGRRYFQMWVGLNTNEGATLYFQFIYPEYLNEPTQTQKSTWSNFVKKTDLMCLSDLMVVRARAIAPDFSMEGKLETGIGLRVEKRRWDQKLLIQTENTQSFSVLHIQENNFFTDFSLCQPYIEIEALLSLNEGEITQEKLRVSYQVVDTFSFDSKMLQINRFSEDGDVLLFH
jgi:hypothetical protein